MDRHARLARNETIFREVNERIEELAQRGEWHSLDILCECGNPDCKEPLRVSVVEYERVRQQPPEIARRASMPRSSGNGWWDLHEAIVDYLHVDPRDPS